VRGVFDTTRPKDLPYGEAPLAVRWHKRTAFTESIAELPPYARITGPDPALTGACRVFDERNSSASSSSGITVRYRTTRPGGADHRRGAVRTRAT
jgi:hypothetical protein